MAHANYLTYAEYTAYGGTLTQTAFTPLEWKARKRIDYITDSRVEAMETVPDCVKICMFAIINIDAVAGAEAGATAPAVTSFSADGYSESYGNAYSADEAGRQMNKTVQQYLYGEKDDNGVPLLYRGVYEYE